MSDMSGNGVTYDASRLQRLLEQLSPKEREKAMRGAFRQSAGKVRREAVKNLRQTTMSYGPGDRAQVERGIRAIVYRRKAGFRVTIGTRKRKRIDYSGTTGLSRSLRRKWERLTVVPLWADAGTWKRHTRKGKKRGAMPAYPFMTRTRQETVPTVEADLKKRIIDNIERTARRNGCRTD